MCLPDTQIEEAEDAEPQPERLGSPWRMELDGADTRSAITPTGSPSIGAICASAGRVAAATLRAASAINAAEASAAAKAAR